MKKKLYLRTQTLVLVLLLILTSLVVSPQQALADTEAASDEDMTEISADGEVTPDVSDKEEQNDLEQSSNEIESDTVSGTDITDNQNAQDPDDEMSDPAEPGIGTRAGYTPEEYFYFDEKTGTITGYREAGPRDVNIPPSIDGVKVEYIGWAAFSGCGLKSVTIPDSVLEIGQEAFESNKLKNVTIPNKVKIIDCWAFCSNELTSVTISDSVKFIGEYAFEYNELKNVTIPSNVTTIDCGAFSENELTSVTISEGVNLIGDYAFSHNQLTSVTLPSSLRLIGGWAFVNNNISRASIPEGIEKIYFTQGPFDPIISPTIQQVGEYCFDEGVSLIGKYYIKANSIIRNDSDGTVIVRPWRPLRVTGTCTSQGAWLRFRYNGKAARVAMSATTHDPPSMTGYAKQTLNLRDAPSGSIIGKIPIGRKVSGNLVENMVKTTYNGKTGYVYASLLQKNPVKVTRYIKANSIIRSTPNGSIIARPWRPLRVTGTIRGAWLKFTYNKKTAYVAMSSTTTSNPPMTGYAKQTLNIRNTPKGSIIGKIPIGRKVSGVLAGNMVKTTYKGKTGYVYASLLQKNPVQVTRYIKANSIIRRSPNGSIIARPWRPIRVTGTIRGAWLKFTYNNRTAYVAMSATTTSNPPMTGYAKRSLNLRNTPKGSIIGTIPRGIKVSGVLVGNMVKTTYKGKTGYVYASLLQKDPVK